MDIFLCFTSILPDDDDININLSIDDKYINLQYEYIEGLSSDEKIIAIESIESLKEQTNFTPRMHIKLDIYTNIVQFLCKHVTLTQIDLTNTYIIKNWLLRADKGMQKAIGLLQSITDKLPPCDTIDNITQDTKIEQNIYNTIIKDTDDEQINDMYHIVRIGWGSIYLESLDIIHDNEKINESKYFIQKKNYICKEQRYQIEYSYDILNTSIRYGIEGLTRQLLYNRCTQYQSQQLLSKIIVIGFSPYTTTILRHTIYVFLELYCCNSLVGTKRSLLLSNQVIDNISSTDNTDTLWDISYNKIYMKQYDHRNILSNTISQSVQYLLESFSDFNSSQVIRSQIDIIDNSTDKDISDTDSDDNNIIINKKNNINNTTIPETLLHTYSMQQYIMDLLIKYTPSIQSIIESTNPILPIMDSINPIQRYILNQLSTSIILFYTPNGQLFSDIVIRVISSIDITHVCIDIPIPSTLPLSLLFSRTISFSNISNINIDSTNDNIIWPSINTIDQSIILQYHRSQIALSVILSLLTKLTLMIELISISQPSYKDLLDTTRNLQRNWDYFAFSRGTSIIYFDIQFNNTNQLVSITDNQSTVFDDPSATLHFSTNIYNTIPIDTTALKYNYIMSITYKQRIYAYNNSVHPILYPTATVRKSISQLLYSVLYNATTYFSHLHKIPCVLTSTVFKYPRST